MNDPELFAYQQEIRRRAAELHAIAAELEVDVGQVVGRSRELREEAKRLRGDGNGSPTTERPSERVRFIERGR